MMVCLIWGVSVSFADKTVNSANANTPAAIVKAADAASESSVNLTFIYPSGCQVVYPVESGTSMAIEFTTPTDWEINSLSVNGDDVTSNIDATTGVYPSTGSNEYSENTTFIITTQYAEGASDAVVTSRPIYASTDGMTLSIGGLTANDRICMTNLTGVLLLDSTAKNVLLDNGIAQFDVWEAGVYYLYINATPSAPNNDNKVEMTGGTKFCVVFTEE